MPTGNMKIPTMNSAIFGTKSFRVIVLACVAMILWAYYQTTYIHKESALALLGKGEVAAELGKQNVFPRLTNARIENFPYKHFVNHTAKDEYLRDVQNALPFLPVLFWKENENENLFYKNSSCAKFPNLYDLEYNNIFWQIFNTSNGTFYLFSAYYDVRNLTGVPSIRIQGVVNRQRLPVVQTFCQMWFPNRKEPVIEKVADSQVVWNFGGFNPKIMMPFMMTCRVPQSLANSVPVAVSLVEKFCDIASNSLRVIYNPADEPKKRFAVCVKYVDYTHEDVSVQLVEWVELLFILGANKIYFYPLKVHENVHKVYEYYEKQSKAEITWTMLPGKHPNAFGIQHYWFRDRVWQRSMDELISYNDCLYKNMYKYDYIVPIDTDEVIIPVKHRDWIELLDMLSKEAKSDGKVTPTSYNAVNVYFPPNCYGHDKPYENIPSYMFMCQNTYRWSESPPGAATKSFMDTGRVLAMHNHFPMRHLQAESRNYGIKVTDAKLHHYHSPDGLTYTSCAKMKPNMSTDTTIWKYKEQLIERTLTALYDLGFVDDPPA